MTAKKLAKVTLCPECKLHGDATSGHFSPIDGRWVSHIKRVPSGRLKVDGRDIFIIPPEDKLMSRVRESDSGCWGVDGASQQQGLRNLPNPR